MKPWAIVALVAAVPLSMATEAVAQEVFLDARLGTASCSAAPQAERLLPAREGRIVVRVENEGDAARARLCLIDAWGRKHADVTPSFGARETREIPLTAPVGSYEVRIETLDGWRAHAAATASTRWCLPHADGASMSFSSGPSPGVGASGSGDCLPGSLAIGVFGLFASGTVFALGKYPGGGALLLYSRLAKPRLLDHSVRERVHALVAREPGIHSRGIVRAAGASQGQAAHHLGVLAREGMLSSVGAPGFRHWFVSGRYSPDQMRAIATLRDRTRRRLYDAAVADPGASLGDLGRAIGVSLPQASRAARALERAGLVERRRDGRALALRPLRTPAELYGAPAQAARA